MYKRVCWFLIWLVGTVNDQDSVRAHITHHDPTDSYETLRARVDAAHSQMRDLVAISHVPAQARAAATELTAALRAATDLASRNLQAAALAVQPPRHRLGRRKADRSVPPAVRPWSAELVRLAEIGVWLRRTTLDDPGVHLPMTVRVANYAAKGPHIAGLDFGNQAAESAGEPRIGIDLAATLDATSALRPGGPVDRATASATAATIPAKAA